MDMSRSWNGFDNTFKDDDLENNDKFGCFKILNDWERRRRLAAVQVLCFVMRAIHLLGVASQLGVDSSVLSLESLLSSDTPTQSDKTKGVKRKAHMMDLLEKQIEVINSGINGVVEALREGNTIAKKGILMAERQVAIAEMSHGINGVVEALKEGNAIAKKGILIAERQVAIAEMSHLKVYSEKEVYDELKKIGVAKNLMVDAIIYLLKNPIDLKTFFAIPSDMRLELLYKLMNM